MITSRDINALHPRVCEMFHAFIGAAGARGIHLILTATYRDDESQNALYAIGRTVVGADVSASRPMGRIVTKAKAGDSFHNYRVAGDVCPIIHGKAVWNDGALWEEIGSIGKSVGLEWAGDWKQFKESPHFQYTGGLTLADFKAGKTLPV